MQNTPSRKQIGKRLQKKRKEAGYKSARAFAGHIGMEPGTYTAYEQGISPFTFERAWQFADALNCTLDELGGRTPPNARAYTDKGQEALNGYFESMNTTGRNALVETARLMADGDSVRIEKEEQEVIPLPPEVGRIA